MNQHRYHTSRMWWVFILVSMLVSGCFDDLNQSAEGGFGPLAEGGIEGTGKSIGPISGFGSVIMNGVRLDTTDTRFIFEGQPATQSQLFQGMVISATSEKPRVADTIEFRFNLVGVLDAPPGGKTAAEGCVQKSSNLIAVGQPIRIDQLTVQRNVDVDSLQCGDTVAVSGFYRQDGIVASYLEKLDSTSPLFGTTILEGEVNDLNPQTSTFRIGDQGINYATAQLSGFSDGLQKEVSVRITGREEAGVVSATHVEKLGFDADPSVTSVDVSGIITAFEGSLDAGGILLGDDTPILFHSPGPEFVNGSYSDIAINTKVLARTVPDASGSLVAKQIIFAKPDNISVEADVAALDPTRGTVTLAGLTVVVNSFTLLLDTSVIGKSDFSLDDIDIGDRLSVLGYEEGQRTVTASRLQRISTVSRGSARLTGHVGPSINDPEFSIAGLRIDATDIEFTTRVRRGFNKRLSRAQFLESVKSGELVRVFGTPQGEFLSASEVSLFRIGNFTVLGRDNQLAGGANDIAFTWDGTLNDAVAGAVSNATLSSGEAFLGGPWAVHDVMLYGPGTYTVYDGCGAGNPNCGAGQALTFTVGAKQIGAHMLFDWFPPGASFYNMDIVNIWSFRTTWDAEHALTTSSPLLNTARTADGLPILSSTTTIDLVSTDWNGDGVAAAPITEGPLTGFYANFNINGINFPPAANDIRTSALVDTPKVIDLAASATHPDGTVVPGSVAIVPDSGPTNGTLVNNGDGTVTYTPNMGFVSPPTDSFQYTIEDNKGATSNAATVTVTVTAVANSLPVAYDTSLTASEDISLDIDITTVATDADVNDSLTFANFDSRATRSGTVSVDSTNTALTYTPAANFDGSDTFTFSVTDGADNSNTATLTVTMNPVNDPLVCTDAKFNTAADMPLDIGVMTDLSSNCTDPDAGDVMTLASTTQPTTPGSTLSFDGGNTLTYTPAAGFNGRDTFTYTATDGTATDTRTVTVNVGSIFGNFTMLDGNGVTFGGSNDIVFTWDGTCYTSVAEADAGLPNMTMGSDSTFPFFGFPWFAHDIKVYCPGGPYTIDTCNDVSIPANKCGPITFTVPAGHLGGHLLFDWNTTTDIDVMNVWNNSTGGTWQNVDPTGQLYPGPAGLTPALDKFFGWISTDADGDGIPGIAMEDGPLIGFRWNLNLKLNFIGP